jgi:hypothetical protein
LKERNDPPGKKTDKLLAKEKSTGKKQKRKKKGIASRESFRDRFQVQNCLARMQILLYYILFLSTDSAIAL